jgi:hypothetical protein
LILAYEADQDVYLFDSLSAEIIIGSNKLGKLPPLCTRILIQKEGLLMYYSIINIIIVQLMNILYLLDKIRFKSIACSFFSFCVS